MTRPTSDSMAEEALAKAYLEWAADNEEVRDAVEWSDALIGDGLAHETEAERRANDAWYLVAHGAELDARRLQR